MSDDERVEEDFFEDDEDAQHIHDLFEQEGTDRSTPADLHGRYDHLAAVQLPDGCYGSADVSDVSEAEVERLYAAARIVVAFSAIRPADGYEHIVYNALNILGGSTRGAAGWT